MRARLPAPRPVAVMATAVLVLGPGLAGCSGSVGAAPADSSSALSTGSSVASPASSTASPASSGASPSASTRVFAVLPESVLTPLPPLAYTTPSGADQSMVAQGAQPAVSAVFAGGVSRELAYQGTTVGGVELYRFGADVPVGTRESFVPLMVQSFAQVTPTKGTLGSTPVQVADGARGTSVSVVGWTQGDDVVLVWAQGVPAAEQIAAQYIAQSR